MSPRTPSLINVWKLSFLEFGFRYNEEAASSTISQIVSYARAIEGADFERLWLGEHHAANDSWASPIIPLTLIANATRTLKVGAAGILLLAHHGLEISSNFNLLEQLFPGRVDLGIARALPVLEGNRSALLGRDSMGFPISYDERIRDLVDSYRRHGGGAAVLPLPTTKPRIWLMGSSGRSALVAERHGIMYIHSLFLPESQPMDTLAPTVPDSVAVAGACAETQLEAESLLHLEGSLPVKASIVGTPRDCAAGLADLAMQTRGREVVFLDCAPRKYRERTVKLLASEIGSQSR